MLIGTFCLRARAFLLRQTRSRRSQGIKLRLLLRRAASYPLPHLRRLVPIHPAIRTSRATKTVGRSLYCPARNVGATPKENLVANQRVACINRCATLLVLELGVARFRGRLKCDSDRRSRPRRGSDEWPGASSLPDRLQGEARPQWP